VAISIPFFFFFSAMGLGYYRISKQKEKTSIGASDGWTLISPIRLSWQMLRLSNNRDMKYY